MQYEFYLTDDCNRSCKFCKIPKNKFYATKEQADFFWKTVLIEQKNIADKYDLMFYGGEPLLNIDVLKYLINLFKADTRCIMHLTTNADFLDSFLNCQEFARIDKIILSVYDIFKDFNKYTQYLTKIKNCIFTYTFTDDDICNINKYTKMCYNINVKFRTVTSHSAKSWININENLLYLYILDAYVYLLKMCLEHFRYTGKFLLQEDAYLLIKRLVLCIYYNDRLSDLWCTSCDKKSFYNGKFIGKCLMLQNLNYIETLLPHNCIKCIYRKACTRSCRFELIDGEINNKLCCIEHAKFDAICKFLIDYKNDVILLKFLIIYVL